MNGKTSGRLSKLRKPNDGQHIKEILSRTTCEKHKVPKGIPCFHIKFDTLEAYGPAICNDRVVKAGFVGTISPSSQSRSQKSSSRQPDGKPQKRRYGSATTSK